MPHLTIRAVAAGVAAFCLAAPVSAETVQGRVVRVVDGDTIIVLAGRDQVRVRLAGIDAPERPGQPYSVASRDALAQVVAGKMVTVTYDAHDQYGRVIGQVDASGVNANTQQLQRGYAWVYARFNRSPIDQAIQAQARFRRVGLWADPAPIPPWQWRRVRK